MTGRRRAAILLVAVALFAFPAAAAAQGAPSESAESEDGPDVSPGGVFARSLVVPGWGHAVTGTHLRGGFYVAAQSGTLWMLAKSFARRGEASRFRDAEFRLTADRIRASGVVEPDSVRALAGQDPRVEEWDELVEARSQQVEDWAALGIFLVLMGAADAYVAAHLMDRPEPLSMDVAPRPGGGWAFSVSVRPGW